MSTTIDQKVVEMKFDNRQFESNVKTSMSTLERLKQSLNLTGAAKGLETVNTAAKGFNATGLGNAVEAVRSRFSALEVMGVTALANITNQAVNTGKRLVSALTVDPIKLGFQEYETQINSVQTILANTQSKGTTLKDVNAALDELNTYADKTIYNFTEMTRNIGTFTAAGVDLDTSVNAIQGIANLAAVSGSTSQQASTAMYQLSQALAAGTVKLMDWNSVVNAGMGGQIFQDALKKTSKELNTGAEAAIKAKGSFRESLQTGWLTSEVLTETLKKFTTSGANEYIAEYTGLSEKAVQASLDSAKAKYGEADAIEYASKALAKKSGKDANEIKSVLELAKTSEDAATKVKTFSQLWDTLKEAAQSGWTQSWEIIVGDFEEAKTLLTEISDTVGAMIGKSADARNQVLQGWKDLGGRTDLIDSFRNVFEGVLSIAKPIKEAFREIFPPVTAKQLANFTKGLKELTSHLKVSDETAKKIKSTFKGAFAILDIGVEAFKALGKGAIMLTKSISGIGGGILDTTSSIGDFLVVLRDSIVKTNMFGKAIDKAVCFLTNIITKIKDFGKSIDIGFKSPTLTGFLGVLEGVWNIVRSIGSKLGSVFASIGSGISGMLGKGDILEVLNSGIFAGILLTIQKFTGGLSDSLKNVNGVLSNAKGILNDVRECFKAYQEQLRAGTLLKIASAIGILAAAIFVISTIDEDALVRALGGITVLFAELLGSLAIFTQISTEMKGVTKSISIMVAMSIAILILSGAMKKLSSISWEGIAKGLVGVGFLMAELAKFMDSAKFDKKLKSSAIGIVILASSMLILAKAVEKFGSMSLEEICKGLASIAVLLIELDRFTKLTGNAKHVMSTGIAMILLGAAMKIFASVIKDFAEMELEKIGKGLATMAKTLAELTIALHLIPKNTLSIGAGLIAVSAAMAILANTLSSFGSMSWEEIDKGLDMLGGALLELSIGLNLMNGTLAGSAALIIAAGALAIIAPAMMMFNRISLESIGKGLAALAGAFIVVGVAGSLLSPLIPAILGLAGAFALLGIATVTIGAGILAISTAFTALAAAGTAGATAIVAAITVIVVGLADLIPTIAEKFGEALIAFSVVIGECAPQLAESFLKLISSVLDSLATYTPQIVNSLMIFLIGLINGIANNLPSLITAAVNLVGSFLKGVVDALNGIDAGNLLKGILSIGLLTGLMYALAGVVTLIPSAMAGVLGLGVVVAELALVLAAIGGLAQIPGLQWLVSEGGNFLQAIGTAIGQFIGGIVGGVAKGMTSSLPGIGTNLSNFMTNLQPFLNGAKSIDPSILDNVKSLAKIMVMLTAADVLNSATSWLTGGSSMADFADQLVPFGKAMKEFSDEVTGIDERAVTASASAGKAIAELAKNLPNSGGVAGFFAGENDLDDFANKLKSFGTAMKEYAAEVAGIDAGAVTDAVTAAKSLAELVKNLPNSGGLVSLFSGDNTLSMFGDQLATFGTAMKKYSDAVVGIDSESVMSSTNAAKNIIGIATDISNRNGVLNAFSYDMSSFSQNLSEFGRGLRLYSSSVLGIDAEAVATSVTAAKSITEVAKNLPNSGGLATVFTGNNNMADFADNLVPFGKALKKYSSAVTGIDAESIAASAKAAKAISEVAKSLPNSGGLVSVFTGDNNMADFASGLVPFGKNLKKYSLAVSGVNAEAVTASVSAAKSLVKLVKVVSVASFASAFTNDSGIGSIGSKLVPFGESLKKYANEVSGINAGAVNAATGAAKEIAKLINSLSGLNANGVNVFKNAINTLGKVEVNKFVNAFSGSNGKISAAGEKMMDALAKGISSKRSTAIKSFTNIVTAMINALKNKGFVFTSAGSDLMAKFTNGLKKSSSKVENIVRSVASKSVSKVRDYYNKFYIAGSYLVDGFAYGISDKTWKAEAKAKAMASAALEAAKEALDEHSPSKESYKVGGFFGQGFINALADYETKTYKAGYNMADYARKGFSKSIRNVQLALNSGIDVQPTIRPVVDLSAVEAGAGAISGMFEEGISIGTTANVNAINSMMRARSQNGNNDDVVSAITGLRKDIGKIQGNTYNVNGITYDDGSNISNAISDIIREARIERRM